MSITKSMGYSDTAVSGVTAPTITTKVLNFESDFRVKSESAKEVVLVNTTTPLDQNETIRFGFSEIADIYAKSGINSDLVVGSKKGINLLSQLTEIVKVTDSANSAFTQYLPISAHLVIKVPQSSYIDSALVQDLITRLISTLYQNGASLVPALAKGVLTPKGL